MYQCNGVAYEEKLATQSEYCMICRPAHALYFATYEVAKQRLGVQRSSHAPLSTAAAGAFATIVNDALMTPGDVVKQRLQLANSPYNGMVDCIVKTYRSEGFRAFFRSYKLTVRCTVSHLPLRVHAGAAVQSCVSNNLPNH